MGFDIVAEFEGVLHELDAAALEYAVCGGFAVSIHGHVRATKDIDLLIRREALDQILRSVRRPGFTIDGGPIPFGVGTRAERELYRVSKSDGKTLLTLDLLLVTPVFEEVWRTRERARWGTRGVWVVSLAGLERMKRLAGRTQDLADLEALGLLGDGSR